MFNILGQQDVINIGRYLEQQETDDILRQNAVDVEDGVTDAEISEVLADMMYFAARGVDFSNYVTSNNWRAAIKFAIAYNTPSAYASLFSSSSEPIVGIVGNNPTRLRTTPSTQGSALDVLQPGSSYEILAKNLVVRHRNKQRNRVS
jgi:hypothetical protein